ncbi:MAG: LuxR C-terminal-related transcriptional regulator [Thermodesulfobacteriota bacterium]
MSNISQRYTHFFGDSDPLQIANSRSAPAIMLLNYELKIVYHNKAAAELLNNNLSTIDNLQKTEGSPPIPQKLLDICNKYKTSTDNLEAMTEMPLFIIGNPENDQVYLCFRVLPMSSTVPMKVKRYTPYFIVMIERIVCPKSFKLSRRETEVLELLFMGHSNKEIANQLYIALYTVEDHIKNLIRKFKVKSRLSIITKFLEFHQ